jgi:hypothetical protein
LHVLCINDVTDGHLGQIAGVLAGNERNDFAVRAFQSDLPGLVIDRLDDGIDHHRLAGMERRAVEFVGGNGCCGCT